MSQGSGIFNKAATGTVFWLFLVGTRSELLKISYY